MEKIYKLEQIAKKAFCSESKIKSIIKEMQIIPAYKDCYGAHYFTKEQTKIIIENDVRNYEVTGYEIFNSKMN